MAVSKVISSVVWVFGFVAPMMAVFTMYCPLLENTGPVIIGVLNADDVRAFGTTGSVSP